MVTDRGDHVIRRRRFAVRELRVVAQAEGPCGGIAAGLKALSQVGLGGAVGGDFRQSVEDRIAAGKHEVVVEGCGIKAVGGRPLGEANPQGATLFGLSLCPCALWQDQPCSHRSRAPG